MGLVKVLRVYLNTYNDVSRLINELKNYCKKLNVIKSSVVPAFIFLELWSPELSVEEINKIITKYLKPIDIVRIDLVEVKVKE